MVFREEQDVQENEVSSIEQFNHMYNFAEMTYTIFSPLYLKKMAKSPLPRTYILNKMIARTGKEQQQGKRWLKILQLFYYDDATLELQFYCAFEEVAAKDVCRALNWVIRLAGADFEPADEERFSKFSLNKKEKLQQLQADLCEPSATDFGDRFWRKFATKK